MSFANRALNTMSSFVKNKSLILLGSGILMAGAALSQTNKGMRLTPKPQTDTVATPVKTTTPIIQDSVPVKKSSFPKKATKKRDNGFYTMNVGATYSPKTSLWNSGTQFNWHGNVAVGKPETWAHRNMQFRAGFTLRNKKQAFTYNYTTPNSSGTYTSYYKPNEVDAHFLVGPKIAIPNMKDKRYNRGVIMPYIGVGGSYGWGSSVNEVTYMSPETVEGVQVLLGKISKVKKDKNGEEKAYGNTVAISLFAEARQQYVNPVYGNRNASYYFPPNTTANGNSFRLGVSIAWARL